MRRWRSTSRCDWRVTRDKIRRDWRTFTISKKSSSLHVVIRQSFWEEVKFYQEVRSDKQLVSYDIKLKDVSAVKDFFKAKDDNSPRVTVNERPDRQFRLRDLIVACHTRRENESICFRFCLYDGAICSADWIQLIIAVQSIFAMRYFL